MMRGAISDITKAVGHTPIVKLNRVTEGLESDIYVESAASIPAAATRTGSGSP